MDNEEKDKIVAKFPPAFRKMYEHSVKMSKDGHRHIVRKVPANLPVSRLVHRIEPNTVLGRVSETAKQPFIQPVSVPHTSSVNAPPVAAAEVNNATVATFVVKDWIEYYELIRHNEMFTKEPEVASFVKLVESIPKACGCVRGALNESANAQYSQMLPLLHARAPALFDEIKRVQNASSILFKDKDLELLTV